MRIFKSVVKLCRAVKHPKDIKNREHGHVLDDEEIVVRERISRNPDYQLTVLRSVPNHNI